MSYVQRFNLTGFRNANGGSAYGNYFGSTPMFADAAGQTLSNCRIDKVSLIFNRIAVNSDITLTLEIAGQSDTYHFTDPFDASWALNFYNFSAAAFTAASFTIKLYANKSSYIVYDAGCYLDVTYTPLASEVTVSPAVVDAGSAVRANIAAYDTAYEHRAFVTFGARVTETVSCGAGVRYIDVTVPESFLDQIPNAASGMATLTLQTYSGGVCVGEKTASFILRAPDSCVPTFTSDCAPLLTVGGTTFPPMGEGVYVQGHSGVRAALSNPAGKYGASIVSTAITVAGTGFSKNGAGSITLDSGLLTMRGEVNVTFTVADSRGQSAARTVTISVSAYNAPTCAEFTTSRVLASGEFDDFGEYAKFTAKWNHTAFGGNNPLTVTLTCAGQSRVLSGTEVNDFILSADDILSIDPLSTHIVTLTLQDLFEKRVFTRELLSAAYIVHFNAWGDGMGVGKASEHRKALELSPVWEFYVYGKSLRDFVYPPGSFYLSAESISPETSIGGTWESTASPAQGMYCWKRTA